MNNNLYDKILGSLAGCAIGDAMGSATELLSGDEIIRHFGGIVQDFKRPLTANPYAGGREAGQITDDASLTFYLAETYITAGGKITPRLIADTILRWSENGEYFPRFAGPSTKSAIERLRRGEDPIVVGRQGEISPGGVTNGGAMKVSPAGLVNPGNFDQAVSDAIIICQPTHGTQIAMSGAAAVACAIAEALTEGSTVMSVIKAALRGAVQGETIGRKVGRIAAGPSVVKRIELAVHIALAAPDAETACRRIADFVGSGLHMAEAVPAALGLFLAADGDLFESIKWAVNIGDDTDTVGAIAGSVAGAFNGFQRVPPHLYEQVTANNHLRLDKLAAGLTEIAERHLS
jgi:ADP-ribosylglycohydrolase